MQREPAENEEFMTETTRLNTGLGDGKQNFRAPFASHIRKWTSPL
jgi:hypothetical protein